MKPTFSTERGREEQWQGLKSQRKRNEISCQRRRNEREAAALTTAENELEDQREEENVEVEWADNTQLQMQPGQLSYLDTDDKQDEAIPGSQALLLAIPLDSNEDCMPRRSRRVKKPSKAIESQQWKIANGSIPEPGAKARTRALNAKKKKTMEATQVPDEFELTE
jgi:hypothetical protein